MTEEVSQAVALLEKQGAIVILPDNTRQTREALHKALDMRVAMFIASAPLGNSPLLSRTSVMDFVIWSHANLEAGGQ